MLKGTKFFLFAFLHPPHFSIFLHMFFVSLFLYDSVFYCFIHKNSFVLFLDIRSFYFQYCLNFRFLLFCYIFGTDSLTIYSTKRRNVFNFFLFCLYLKKKHLIRLFCKCNRIELHHLFLSFYHVHNCVVFDLITKATNYINSVSYIRSN